MEGHTASADVNVSLAITFTAVVTAGVVGMMSDLFFMGKIVQWVWGILCVWHSIWFPSVSACLSGCVRACVCVCVCVCFPVLYTVLSGSVLVYNETHFNGPDPLLCV